MNENESIRIFNNKGLGLQVRTILNEGGSISVNVEDAARGFGFIDESKFATTGETYVRWTRVNKYLSEFGFPQEVGQDDYIPEGLFYLLGMKANNRVAQEFQKWLALDVLPTLRKMGGYSVREIIPRSDIGEIASLMKAWLSMMNKGKIPYQHGIAEMIKFMQSIGIPITDGVLHPDQEQLMQLSIDFSQNYSLQDCQY